MNLDSLPMIDICILLINQELILEGEGGCWIYILVLYWCLPNACTQLKQEQNWLRVISSQKNLKFQKRLWLILTKSFPSKMFTICMNFPFNSSILGHLAVFGSLNINQCLLVDYFCDELKYKLCLLHSDLTDICVKIISLVEGNFCSLYHSFLW